MNSEQAAIEQHDTPAAPVEELAPGEVEVVDGLPVLAEVRALEPAAAALPAVQAAAAAATGFVAGAAVIALARRHAVRRATRTGRRAGRRGSVEALPVVATRTFLVDVHLLGRPGD